MLTSESPNINFYWFTQEQLTKIWFHINETPDYRTESYADTCLRITLQLKLPTVIAGLVRENPQEFDISKGEVKIPIQLFEKICELLEMRYLIGDLLLDNPESAAYVLGILSQREHH